VFRSQRSKLVRWAETEQDGRQGSVPGCRIPTPVLNYRDGLRSSRWVPSRSQE
jgi:hypothetical protein